MRTLLLTVIFYPPVVLATTAAPVANGPWWLPHALTLLGIILAAMMIVYQLGRQHADETKRQNENFKGQLKLQIYQEFSQELTSASSAIVSASVFAHSTHVNAKIKSSQAAKGWAVKPLGEPAQELVEKNYNAVKEATKVIFLIEKYQIIHPDLDIFKVGISTAIHDLSEVSNKFHTFLLNNFPAAVETIDGDKLLNVKVLNAEELSTLSVHAFAYDNAVQVLGCYLTDMRTELQKLLLGHLFPNMVPLRKPTDPNYKVITLDPTTVKSLYKYFDEDTTWGRKCRELQEEVDRELRQETGIPPGQSSSKLDGA